MRRATVLGAVLGAAIAVAGAPATAIAGAGCHGTMTEADATGEEEATVSMIDACFEASVLRVDPGTSVTFVHQDPGMLHNVGGTEWGFYGEMRKGDSFTATFDDAGVYPFACNYHPGMNGAIVVGDGLGAGTGWTVSNEGPFAPAPKEVPATAEVANAGGGSPLALIAIGLAGAAAGAGVALGVGRLRRSAAA